MVEVPARERPGAPWCGSIHDPARLLALEQAGLTADPDPEMELFAERVRRWVDVPVALVSLVRPGEQVFPGMSGLPEPWASARATPLTHSFCQHVVASAEPLIVSDAREHPLVRENLAVADLGVVAYAGMPLTDEAGHVLGSLCAIDVRPRTWSATHLDALRDLARACSTELRLRLARFDAERERLRRDDLEEALRRSFESSRTLLLASQLFTDTATVADVRSKVNELVSSELHPSYVAIALLDHSGRMQRLQDTGIWVNYDLDAALPTATATREHRTVHYPDRATFDADHPPASRQVLRDLDLHALVAVPLPGTDGPVGAMVLGWDAPRRASPTELLTINTIAGYAARALGRAELLQHRTTAAQQLQLAMLTTLPKVPGLQLAARYQAADSREHVGGDWYDAAPVPGTAQGPTGRDDLALAVSVGDIVGHTLEAATIMGQVRSMLRQAAWDHPGTPPSRTLAALERASAGLGLAAAGTALLAHLRRLPGGSWSLTWSNAGHPPPVLVRPDGTCVLLREHDSLFGFAFTLGVARTDHRRLIEPGSTLFLYSDGLVEGRRSDIDAGTEELLALLYEVRDRPPQAVVDVAVDTLARDAPDDVVAFGIHFSRHD